MIDLSNLRPAPGAMREKMRVGRGPGSGKGKTCGRGHKGQKARAGGGKPPWYEGGQTPLYRRTPKRGFHNPFRKEYQIVNLDQVASRFREGEEVTRETLAERGLVSSRDEPVKVLGRGELPFPLTFRVDAYSRAARQAIERSGGTIAGEGKRGS